MLWSLRFLFKQMNVFKWSNISHQLMWNVITMVIVVASWEWAGSNLCEAHTMLPVLGWSIFITFTNKTTLLQVVINFWSLLEMTLAQEAIHPLVPHCIAFANFHSHFLFALRKLSLPIYHSCHRYDFRMIKWTQTANSNKICNSFFY